MTIENSKNENMPKRRRCANEEIWRKMQLNTSPEDNTGQRIFAFKLSVLEGWVRHPLPTAWGGGGWGPPPDPLYHPPQGSPCIPTSHSTPLVRDTAVCLIVASFGPEPGVLSLPRQGGTLELRVYQPWFTAVSYLGKEFPQPVQSHRTGAGDRWSWLPDRHTATGGHSGVGWRVRGMG